MVDAKPTETKGTDYVETRKFEKGLVQKIVLTGGPCAGKTTAMTYISNKLREMGLKVLIVPEVATIFATGGGLINIHKMTLQQNVRFQTTLIRTIMDLEDRFCELAEISGEQTVVLCDRGVLDSKAYISPEGWQALMDENGFNMVNIRDKRYDAIIHMVTAAEGAEKYYTLENNTARYETDLSVAIDIDRKIRSAWVGHPALIIADNSASSFDEKIRKVYESVLHVIGLPLVPKFYKKYLLNTSDTSKPIPAIPEEIKTEVIQMEDIYIKSSSKRVERKLRKRGQKGSFTYIYSVTQYKNDIEDITATDFTNDGIEKKCQISAREFIALLDEKDPKRKTLEKYRQCFIFEGNHYFIDTFLNSNKGPFSLLNIEATKSIDSLKLPSFFKIEKDVTDDHGYTSFEVSKIIEA